MVGGVLNAAEPERRRKSWRRPEAIGEQRTRHVTTLHISDSDLRGKISDEVEILQLGGCYRHDRR